MIEQLREPCAHILHQPKGLLHQAVEEGCSEEEFGTVVCRIEYLLIDIQDVNGINDESQQTSIKDKI
jgi:hypothetical protein